MLRHVTDSYGPLPADGLRQAEAEIGASLPEAYKQFLTRHNGGRVEPATYNIQWNVPNLAKRFPHDSVHVLFGFQEGSTSDFLKNVKVYRERIPADTVPIGCDPGGNLLLIGIAGPNTGRVLLWILTEEVDWEGGETPDYSNVGLVAPTFDDFLQGLYDR